MLWVRKDVECEQVSVPSADLTVVLLRLPGRSVLRVLGKSKCCSVERDGVAARHRNKHCAAPRRGGPRLDVVVAGDLNCHDQLWGGDEVLPSRQGEAEPVIDFMNRWPLESLLPRGTKT
jgi:hypothetical protein